MSRVETRDYTYRDPEGTVWRIPVGVNTPDELVPRVIEGYVRTQKAQLKVADILKRQADRYPTQAEGGAAQPNVYPEGDYMRTPGQVASDQAANVLRGIPEAVTSIPGAVKSGLVNTFTGNAAGIVNDAASAVKGMVQPFIPPAKAMIHPAIAPPPESPEWSQAARGAGAMLGGAELPNVAGGAGQLLTKGMRKLKPPAQLEMAAAENAAKALQPSSLESKAIVEKIAPELAKRGLKGASGKTIDADIMSRLDEATTRLNKVQDRLLKDPRPEYQVNMEPLINEVQGTISKLSEFPEINADAINAMEAIKKSFERLPKYANFEKVLKLRQTLDNAIQDAGGWKQASSAADRVKMKVQRGAADLLRGALNELDPELKVANQDFSLWRNAADVVERRKLGQVGVSDSGLPSRGGLLDDIIAGWVGNAIGGTPGAALAEGMNLMRQTRGYANIKSNAQQRLADILKPKGRPRPLLTAGKPELPPVPDGSYVRGVSANNPDQ